MPHYTLLDHTADVGVKISADHPHELFATAAFAMFDIVTDIGRVEGRQRQKVCIQGADWPDLMVNWLRELLFLWSARQMLFKTCEMRTLSEHALDAEIWFDTYDPVRHIIKEELKAVTYHQIQVRQDTQGWQARIIFDV